MEDSFDESEKKGNDFSEYLLDRVRQLEERNLKLRDANRKVENEKRSAENQKVRYEREVRKLRSELERLKGPPLLVGTVLDVLDDNRVVIKSSTGPKFVVNASQFIEQELIAGARVALNQQSLAIVGALPPSKDPTVYGMEIIETPTVSYDDIGGLDGQIQELRETVELPILKPELFQRVGIEPPKGVLLYGPPGTGKTLLAKAVAKQTESVFIRIVGSELVQKYIGEGARLVRELFEMAREKAPSIIFIDELDALGRARGISGLSGGHDEKEQTLNQLLSELDGFDPTIGVVLLAATNRPEVLDPALLRAGRFDRQVSVDRPDKIGRVGILQVHLKKIKLATGVDPAVIAALTPGFTGADLANLVNEAAVLATRRRAQSVSLEDFTAAIERVIAGPEKRNRLLNPRERRIVAFHEMGHAIVAMALPDTDSIKKVSIIPRGIGALGYTMQMPTEDRYLMTRTELLNRMTVLLGGRAAEMVIFAEATTGAADDLQRATEMARAMVTRYGMEPEIGQASLVSARPRYLDLSELGQRQSEASDETNAKIDNAIRDLIEQAFNRACDILRSCAKIHQESAQHLLDKETFGEDDLAPIRAAVIECRDHGAKTTSGAGTETA